MLKNGSLFYVGTKFKFLYNGIRTKKTILKSVGDWFSGIESYKAVNFTYCNIL